jgi:hypothetical protein
MRLIAILLDDLHGEIYSAEWHETYNAPALARAICDEERRGVACDADFHRLVQRLARRIDGRRMDLD